MSADGQQWSRGIRVLVWVQYRGVALALTVAQVEEGGWGEGGLGSN